MVEHRVKNIENRTKRRVRTYLFDSLKFGFRSLGLCLRKFERLKISFIKPLVVVINKLDLLSNLEISTIQKRTWALNGKLVSRGAEKIGGSANLKILSFPLANAGALRSETIIAKQDITLLKTLDKLYSTIWYRNILSGDLMALDIREAFILFQGMITGRVTNDEDYWNIFANFFVYWKIDFLKHHK
jgi:tRNA modification GTPase